MKRLKNPQPSTYVIASLRAVGFWRTFEAVSTGKALLVVWRSLLGSDFPSLQSFLRPTPERSLTYPCTRVPWCECNHDVIEDSDWEQVATCTCGDCEPFPLTREHTMLYALNCRAFGESVRQALGFAPPLTTQIPQPSTLNPQPLHIGSYPPLRAHVYFYAPTNTADLTAELNCMLAGPAGPFLLLTPTSTFITPSIQASLARAACAHIALSTLLAPSDLARFSVPSSATSGVSTLNHQLSTILHSWTSAVVARPGPSVLEDLHREIASVRHDFVELRSAKQRLEKMQAEGVFAFTQKVDATSFKILCAVLAHGDVAKAARVLGIGDPMMRKLLRQWRTRGPAYQAMLDLVRWRKKAGRKETLRLNDAILHEKADTTDYPALLSDLLDGLLSMTDTNWQDLAEELAQLLRPIIAAGTQSSSAGKTPIR